MVAGLTYPNNASGTAHSCATFLQAVITESSFAPNTTEWPGNGSKPTDDVIDYVCNADVKTKDIIDKVGTLILMLLERTLLIPGLIHTNAMLWQRSEIYRQELEEYMKMTAQLKAERKSLIELLARQASQLQKLVNQIGLGLSATGELTLSGGSPVDLSTVLDGKLGSIGTNLVTLNHHLASISTGELNGVKLGMSYMPRIGLTFASAPAPSVFATALNTELTAKQATITRAAGLTVPPVSDLESCTTVTGNTVSFVATDTLIASMGAIEDAKYFLQMVLLTMSYKDDIAGNGPATLEFNPPMNASTKRTDLLASHNENLAALETRLAGSGGVTIGGGGGGGGAGPTPRAAATAAVFAALPSTAITAATTSGALPQTVMAGLAGYAGSYAAHYANGPRRRNSTRRSHYTAQMSEEQASWIISKFLTPFHQNKTMFVEGLKTVGGMTDVFAKEIVGLLEAASQVDTALLTALAEAEPEPEAEAAGPTTVEAARLDLSNVSLGETESRDEVYERALALAQKDCVKEYCRVRPCNNGDLRATEIQMRQKGKALMDKAKKSGKSIANIPKFERSLDADPLKRQQKLQDQVWTKFKTNVGHGPDGASGTCLDFTEVFVPSADDKKGEMFKHFIRSKPADGKYIVTLNGGVLDDFQTWVKGGRPLVHTDFLKYGNRMRPTDFQIQSGADGSPVATMNDAEVKAAVRAKIKGQLAGTYDDWKRMIAAPDKTSPEDFATDFAETMKFSAQVDRQFVDTIWPNLDVYFPINRPGKDPVPPKNVILMFYGASGSGKTHSAYAILDKIFETLRNSDEEFNLRLCSDYQDQLYDYYSKRASTTFKKFAQIPLNEISYDTTEVAKLNALAANYRAGDTSAGNDRVFTFFEGLTPAAWGGTLANDKSDGLTAKPIPKEDTAFTTFEANMKKRVAVFRSVTDTGLNPESSRSHLFYIFERKNAKTTDGKYLIVADLAGTEDLNYLMSDSAWAHVQKENFLTTDTNAKNGFKCWVNGGMSSVRDWSCVKDAAFNGMSWKSNFFKQFMEPLAQGWLDVKKTTVFATLMSGETELPDTEEKLKELEAQLEERAEDQLVKDPRTKGFFKGSFKNPNHEKIAKQTISMRGESKHINESLEEIGAMVKHQKELLATGGRFPGVGDAQLDQTKAGANIITYGKWLTKLNSQIVADAKQAADKAGTSKGLAGLNAIKSKQLALRLLGPVMQSKISVILVAALSCRRTNDYDNFATMKNVKTGFLNSCAPEPSSC